MFSDMTFVSGKSALSGYADYKEWVTLNKESTKHGLIFKTIAFVFKVNQEQM